MAKKIKREPRYFQYIDGEQKGKVVILKDIFKESGETFLTFDDGESINSNFISPMVTSIKSLKNKFLVEVQSPEKNYLWRFKKVKETIVDLGNQETVVAPPIEDIIQRSDNKDENTGLYTVENSMDGKEKIIFPISNNINPEDIKPLPTLDWFYDPNEIEYEETNAKSPKNTSSPSVVESEIFQPDGDMGIDGDMHVMTEEEKISLGTIGNEIIQKTKNLNTQKNDDSSLMSEDEKAISLLIKKAKKHDIEVPITITISLPSKSLFNIVSGEFDNGDELFINEIVKGLSNEQIISSLKDGLKIAYQENGDTTE